MPRRDLIRLRRDAAADWVTQNPVLALGEPGIILSADGAAAIGLVLGDGVTPYVDLVAILPGAGGTGAVESVNGLSGIVSITLAGLGGATADDLLAEVEARAAADEAFVAAFEAFEARLVATEEALEGTPARVLWDADTRTWGVRPLLAPGMVDYVVGPDRTAFPPEAHPDLGGTGDALEGDGFISHPYPLADSLPDPEFDGELWGLPGGPPGPPPPDPTPFPVLPGVVFTAAKVNAWATGTQYNRLNATGYANPARAVTNPGATIALSQLATLVDQSVWGMAQAALWAVDASAPRLAALQAWLNGYRDVVAFEVNAGNQTQRLNGAWMVSNMVRVCSIIGYTDAQFIDDFLIGTVWNPANVAQQGATILDWSLNPNWHATFADDQLGIAVLSGDTALWTRARAYYRRRLAQSIHHKSHDPNGGTTITPLTNDAGAVSAGNTVNHWGGSWGVPQVTSPGFSATGLPNGANGERLRDWGHVCDSNGAWAHGALTILAQGEDLYPDEIDRLRAGLNLHADRVYPYFLDGTIVQPVPTGNGSNFLGGGEVNQSWFVCRDLLDEIGGTGASLIAICGEDEVTNYPPAGANHLTSEALTRF